VTSYIFEKSRKLTIRSVRSDLYRMSSKHSVVFTDEGGLVLPNEMIDENLPIYDLDSATPKFEIIPVSDVVCQCLGELGSYMSVASHLPIKHAIALTENGSAKGDVCIYADDKTLRIDMPSLGGSTFFEMPVNSPHRYSTNMPDRVMFDSVRFMFALWLDYQCARAASSGLPGSHLWRAAHDLIDNRVPFGDLPSAAC
jgi:hypothetical protein